MTFVIITLAITIILVSLLWLKYKRDSENLVNQIQQTMQRAPIVSPIPNFRYNTRYEYWVNRSDKFADYSFWFWDIVNNDAALKPQTTLMLDSGFKDIGSYFTVVLFYNFLYNQNGKHIYLTQYSRPKFNVEFLNSQIAMATLLKLKAINPLKYELNNDQQSIDFYLDSTSLNEIITCYTDI